MSDRNFALNQTVIASSTEASCKPYDAVMDNNLNWRPESRTGDEWIFVDLGQQLKTTKISVRLYALSGYPLPNLTIKCSKDTESWSNIYSKDNAGGVDPHEGDTPNTTVTARGINITGRFVKFSCRSITDGLSLSNIVVNGLVVCRGQLKLATI